MSEAKLTEAQIKALVLGHLRRTGAINEKTVIANEFRLGHTAVRSDLALFSKSFIGVEIKSELDSLRRLPNQVNAYGRHFERFIVVAAPRHVRSIDLSTLSQAEIWIIHSNGKFELITEREPKQCVNYRGIMTLEDTRKYLEIPNARSLGSVSDRDAFESAFNARYGKTSETFWNSVHGRRIMADDLRTLSRFRELREKQELAQQERLQRNSQWCSVAAQHLRVA